MGEIKTLGRKAWRKWAVDGVSASGANKPTTDDIFPFVDEVDEQVDVLSGRVTDTENAVADLELDADSITKATWSDLSAITGTRDGQRGLVPNSDTGTHTDPVVGGTVDNAGTYSWSASPSGWQRVDDYQDVAAIAGDVASIATTLDEQVQATGNPELVLSANFAEVDLDQSDRFVRGYDLAGRHWRAEAHEVSAETMPDAWLTGGITNPWNNVRLDSKGRVVRATDVHGVIHEARGGRLLPVGNTGRLGMLAAYGDSTTWGDDFDTIAGADFEAQRWTGRLAAALGIHVYNRGANGQKSNEIVARLGARLPRATVTGGSIPASGSVALTGVTDDLFSVSGMTYAPRSAVLITDAGQRVRGLMSRSGANAYSFYRYEPGAAIAAAAVDVWCETGWADRAAHVLIGMGVNDEPAIVNSTLSADDIKMFYRAATSGCRGGFTVWGLLDRGTTESGGSAIGDYIREMEAWFRLEYGSNYCAVRPYLASQRALDDAQRLDPGYTPTSGDSAAVSIGTIPPSFRLGGVHSSGLGHQLIALCMERHLRIQYNLEN